MLPHTKVLQPSERSQNTKKDQIAKLEDEEIPIFLNEAKRINRK